MATEHVAAQQNDIYGEDEGSNTDAESVGKEERPNCIVVEKAPDDVRTSQKEAMRVLQDQGQARFVPVAPTRLADCARQRIGPE